MGVATFAILLISTGVKADVTISKTVDVSSKSDTAAVKYASLFKEAAGMGPLGKAMLADIDTTFKGVEVVQLDNVNSIGAQGPTTQYLVLLKFKTGGEKWTLSKLNPLQNVKDAYSGPKKGKYAWTQGDDEEIEIPAEQVATKPNQVVQ